MRGVALGLLVAVLLRAVAGQDGKEEARPVATVSPSPSKYMLPPELNDRSRFFLGRYSTTTYTDVVMVTSTVFFSCLSGTATGVCQGRRRREFLSSSPLRTFIELDEGATDPVLESSQVDLADLKEDTGVAAESSDNADSKLLGINVWTTSRTTTTVTMLYTDTNTTIRLSYYCLAGQIQLPANNCVG
ncbi:uncharacterized protein [Panulirus ornatus]|uniref:uncharacterized protein n=1 Tax=Panulirus ornatus TaxID=150431 RepID=UPI003A8B82E9